MFVPAPQLLSRYKAPPTWTSPAPATRQPPLLVSAHCTAYLRLPPFPVTVSPSHFLPSALSQFPVIPWVIFPYQVHPYPLCLQLTLPELSSESSHLLVLGFLSGGFLHEGERPGRLHSLAVALPGPCSPRYFYIMAPFRLPGSPPPSPISLPPLTCYRLRCPLWYHYLVHSKNNSFFVGIGPILDKELTCIFRPVFSLCTLY